jgi:hypothetical protein
VLVGAAESTLALPPYIGDDLSLNAGLTSVAVPVGAVADGAGADIAPPLFFSVPFGGFLVVVVSFVVGVSFFVVVSFLVVIFFLVVVFSVAAFFFAASRAAFCLAKSASAFFRFLRILS